VGSIVHDAEHITSGTQKAASGLDPALQTEINELLSEIMSQKVSLKAVSFDCLYQLSLLDSPDI
jgi:hypothetical protein